MLYLIAENVVLYWGFSYFLMVVSNNVYRPPLKVVYNVLFNQIVVGWLMLKTLPIMPDTQTFGYLNTPKNLLYVPEYIGLYYILHTVWFYFSHRLMHQRFLWKHVHYVHHQYKDTIPYAAIYCHYLEHAIVNLMSLVIGPILFPSDYIILRLWLHGGTMYSINAHNAVSRRDFLGNHDLHHLFYKYNYGTGMIMDKIFGTYMKPHPG